MSKTWEHRREEESALFYGDAREDAPRAGGAGLLRERLPQQLGRLDHVRRPVVGEGDRPRHDGEEAGARTPERAAELRRRRSRDEAREVLASARLGAGLRTNHEGRGASSSVQVPRSREWVCFVAGGGGETPGKYGSLSAARAFDSLCAKTQRPKLARAGADAARSGRWRPPRSSYLARHMAPGAGGQGSAGRRLGTGATSRPAATEHPRNHASWHREKHNP